MRSLNVHFSHPDGFISHKLESLKNESLKQSLVQDGERPNGENLENSAPIQVQIKNDIKNTNGEIELTDPVRPRLANSDVGKGSHAPSNLKNELSTPTVIAVNSANPLLNKPTASS
jgi:hypothetical protein